jgi:hypothetical protein
MKALARDYLLPSSLIANSRHITSRNWLTCLKMPVFSILSAVSRIRDGTAYKLLAVSTRKCSGQRNRLYIREGTRRVGGGFLRKL